VDNGPSMNHFCVQDGPFAQLTGQETVVPIGPIHHRSDAEPLFCPRRLFKRFVFDGTFHGWVHGDTDLLCAQVSAGWLSIQVGTNETGKPRLR